MIILDPPRDVLAVMDVAKCADVVVCVLGTTASLEEPAFDAQGYRLLTALKAQGLPLVFGAAHGAADATAMLSAKKVAEGKKFVARYFASELSADTKFFPASSDEEVKALVRTLGTSTPKDLTWRTDRGYMMAQEVQYSSAEGLLCLRGYVRGPGFRCRHLSHLTGHGDFAIARITALPDPCPVTQARGGATASSGEEVIDELRPGEEPDVQRLQPYDPMAAEQTWPTTEELGAAVASRAAARRRRPGAVPAPEGANAEGDGQGDADMGTDTEGTTREGDADLDEDDEQETESIAPSGMAETEDGWEVNSTMTGCEEVPSADAVAAERRRRDVLLQRSKEELEFPDEVDTPLDKPARERFARYRGLRSFRTSPWDPYEELPVEYSRIFEFEAFASTGRAFKQQFLEDCEAEEGGGAAARYCAVYLKGVPQSVVESQPSGVPFVLSGLFPCEQKVSVLHGNVARAGDYADAISSKQEMSLHCGFRRFMARPIFSEIPKKPSTCKKFKYMRLLHKENTCCASFYAPVIFPPSRLMMFVHKEAGPELAASGSITGVDPKQLIIKKIVLTGYPFRTHKAKGVVRFMFFRPEDIRWFKPVELNTKKGLRGNITGSVGTHGYMKCRFSNFIKQDDTVCMNLYKRVYPKWYPPSWGGSSNETPEDAV